MAGGVTCSLICIVHFYWNFTQNAKMTTPSLKHIVIENKFATVKLASNRHK